MKLIIFLISLIYLANATQDGKCPDVEVLTNIDQKKLNGFWYPIEEYPNPYDSRFKCSQCDYHLNKNGIIAIYFKGIDLTTKEEQNINYTAEPTGDAERGSYFFYLTKMKNSIKYNPNEQADILNILATDYENYLVLWSCSKIDSENQVWIASRSRTLSKDYLKKGRDVLDKFNLDTAQLKKVDHENCD